MSFPNDVDNDSYYEEPIEPEQSDDDKADFLEQQGLDRE